VLRRLGVALAALAVLLCAQVTPAAAEGEADTGAFGAFRLKGSNRYSVLVMAFSKPRFKHGQVLVFVGRGAGRGFENVLYFAPAKVLPDRVEADLGPVGEISVRFEPSGPPEQVHASCKRGGQFTFEPGAWVGGIDLTGEEEFTEVHVGQTKAIPSPFLASECGVVGIGETGGHGVVGAKLVARSATAKRAIYLQVNKNHQHARVRVEASLEERRGRLIVSREVANFFPPAAFDFDAPLQTADLSPSAPFSGSAGFHRNAKPANQWTGNLSVDFPGRANVPLAGHRFTSALGHWERTEERRGYDRPQRPSLLAALARK